MTDEEAKAVVDSGDRWRVVVVKQSLEDGEAAIEKLEAAGFDATLSSGKANENTKPSDSSGLTSGGRIETARDNSLLAAGANTASARTNPPNRVRLTSRAMAPNREVIAFAGGLSPLHSSAPLTFASSDEKSAPVRFNDKPYRGRIEVFANRRGSLTVVNVIGLEDYVKGVVPNELSFPRSKL